MHSARSLAQALVRYDNGQSMRREWLEEEESLDDHQWSNEPVKQRKYRWLDICRYPTDTFTILKRPIDKFCAVQKR